MKLSSRFVGSALSVVLIFSFFVQSARAEQLLNPWMHYFLDDKGLTPQQVASLPLRSWKKPGKAVTNLGYSDDTLWLQLEVPPTEESTRWLLELRWPFYDSVELFEVNQGVVLGPVNFSGDHYDSEVRYFSSRFPLFIFEDGTQSKTFLMKLNGGNLLLLPVFRWQINDYIREELLAHIMLGLLYGTLLLIGLYNLGIWILVRDLSNLYYVGYVFSIALYQASLSGVGLQYLWRGNAFLSDKMLSLSVGLTFLFGSLFFTTFLSLRERAPLLHRLTLCICTLYFFGTLFALKVPESMLVVPAQIMGAVVSIFALVISSLEWKRGNLLARYFTIAWGFLLVGTCVYTAALANIIPYNRFTEIVQSIAIVTEVVLLSLGLGARISLDREATKRVTEMSLLLANLVNRANLETIQIQNKAKAELEHKVQQRTSELGLALTQLRNINVKLEKLSLTDSLTGLKNRRFFDEVIISEFKRASREQSPLSLLLLDLDHFKQVNDIYGHQSGDECLRQTAIILIAQCRRPSDFAIRLGGEELVLLLPNTNAEGALEQAENIRGSLEKLKIKYDQNEFGITVSIGVATIIPDQSDKPECLLDLADKALYKAKSSGRNTVVAADFYSD